MRDLFVRDRGRVVPWLAAAASLAIGLAIIQPFSDVPVSFDTQATVAYFDRLVRGEHLEQALSTTPKPLLTLVEGGLHALTGDWRPIVWLTMLIQAAAAGLAACLAGGAAGRAAGLAAGLVVAGTPLLIEDTAFGNAVPWALLGWLTAARLMTGARPRPTAAGVALLLAALCRLETLVIVSVMGLAIAWLRFGPWPLSAPRPLVPRGTWAVVVVPFSALLVMFLHDWLLTGDAFFWLKVSRVYSDAVRERGVVIGPVAKVAWFAHRYLSLWPALVLGLAGAISLFRSRSWGVLAGLVAMGPGVAAFIILLAARGLYAPERYALPVDIALLLLAAIGFGWLVGKASRWATARLGSPSAASSFVVAAWFGIAVVGLAAAGAGPFEPRLSADIADRRALNENEARVVRTLSRPADVGPGSAVGWVVPTAVRPRFAVDLGLPLTSVAGLSVVWLDPQATPLKAGQLVYHDTHGDLPRGAYTVLEAGGPVEIDGVTLSPVLLDPGRGLWLYVATGGP